MWQKFLEYLKKNKIVEILVGVILLGLVIVVSLRNSNSILQKRIEVAEQNLKVQNDSIRITYDKMGKEQANKLAYLTDNLTDLKKLNVDLAKAVSDIKSGKVSTIIQGQVQVVEKPVPFIVHGELLDSNVLAHFNYDTTYSPGNFRKLSGFTKYNLKNGITTGQKEQDEFGIKLTTGIVNLDKGKPEIFLKSDYPGFKVTQLDGAVLDPNLFKVNKTPLITPSLTLGWTPIIITQGTGHIVTNQFGATIGVGFNIFKILGIKK